MKKDELINTLAAATRDGYLPPGIDPEWIWLCVAANNRGRKASGFTQDATSRRFRVIGGKTRKRRTRRNVAKPTRLNLFRPMP